MSGPRDARDLTGAGDNNLIGIDARHDLPPRRREEPEPQSAACGRTTASGTADYAAGFERDYPNDLWNVMLSGKRIGENFKPAMGFVPRTGIHSGDLYVAFQPRPERFGIRQFFFEVEPTLITDLQGRVENWRVFTAPFNVRTIRGTSSGTTSRPSSTSTRPSRSSPASSSLPARTERHAFAPK